MGAHMGFVLQAKAFSNPEPHEGDRLVTRTWPLLPKRKSSLNPLTRGSVTIHTTLFSHAIGCKCDAQFRQFIVKIFLVSTVLSSSSGFTICF